jgi:hypothetical protein
MERTLMHFFCDAEAGLSELSPFPLVGDDLKVVGELQVFFFAVLCGHLARLRSTINQALNPTLDRVKQPRNV